ncbi:MAG: hypothetical protein LBT40_09945 [Deltaproteobacteria bacterium]|jgi:hypothetical protein|nr:hypothetical protein [Deltaproteobacteria bacterium]
MILEAGKLWFFAVNIGRILSLLVIILTFFLVTRVLCSSVCWAASGKLDMIRERIHYLKSVPLKDRHQKLIAILDLASFLAFIGVDPKLIPGARLYSTELIDWNSMGLKRPDLIVELKDCSFLIIEFQSTADNRDIFRFASYHDLLAEQLMTRFKRFKLIPPIRVIVVYPATIRFRPSASYPHKDMSRAAQDCSSFTITQIFLADLLDIEDIVKKVRAALKKWDSKGALPLSKLELTKWFLASLGKTPDDPLKALEAIEEYLRTGRYMAKKARDPRLLFRTICGVLARRKFAAENIIFKFMEVLFKMGFSDAVFMDAWTNGKYTQDMEAKAAAEAKFATAEAKLAAAEAEKAALRTTVVLSVLALHDNNKSVEEISSTLKLKKAEVLRILKKNSNGR